MKVRSRFISNSSSSSFIILVNNDKTKEENIQKFKDFIINEYGEDEVEEVLKNYKKAFDMIDDNLECMHINVESGSEESVIDLLNKLNVRYIEVDN